MFQFIPGLLSAAGSGGALSALPGLSAPQIFGQRILSPALSAQNMPSLGTELGPQAKAMMDGTTPPPQQQGALGPPLPEYRGPQAPQIDLSRPAGGFTAPQRASLQFRPTALGGQRWI